jgi:RNA-directed DNA polymerase
MKESNTEGIANHSGPESCAGTSNGVCEALTGVRTGWELSLENPDELGADAVKRSGRQHLLYRHCEIQQDLAWSQTPHMYGNSMHGNREIPWSTAEIRVAVRAENPKG